MYIITFCSDKANYRETLKVLNEMGIHDPSLVDCANVRYICECVSRRSAHLVSAGLAALLNKMDEKSVTIGVDGSVYRFHPYFHKLMVEKTKQLAKSDIKVCMADVPPLLLRHSPGKDEFATDERNNLFYITQLFEMLK